MREIEQEKKLIIINENLKLQNIELELRIKKLKDEINYRDTGNFKFSNNSCDSINATTTK